MIIILALFSIFGTTFAVEFKEELTRERCAMNNFDSGSEVGIKGIVDELPVYEFEYEGETIKLPYCDYKIHKLVSKLGLNGISALEPYTITYGGTEWINLELLEELAEEDSSYEKHFLEYRRLVEKAHWDTTNGAVDVEYVRARSGRAIDSSGHYRYVGVDEETGLTLEEDSKIGSFIGDTRKDHNISKARGETSNLMYVVYGFIVLCVIGVGYLVFGRKKKGN